LVLYAVENTCLDCKRNSSVYIIIRHKRQTARQPIYKFILISRFNWRIVRYTAELGSTSSGEILWNDWRRFRRYRANISLLVWGSLLGDSRFELQRCGTNLEQESSKYFSTVRGTAWSEDGSRHEEVRPETAFDAGNFRNPLFRFI